MPTPFLDLERTQLLETKVGASSRKGMLRAWPRQEDQELPLVQLEVDWVRFSTLNHRTRAEQAKLVRARARADLFTADPLGDEAQDAQYGILKSQEGFEDLKRDLENRGQQDEAVVTAEGVLINGNRRVAALRSLYHDENNLGSQYVRCLVLPTDATPDEMVRLETELQVARDFRLDYSWINQALLIQELYEENNRDFAFVAELMHRQQTEIEAQYEKLQQVNQLSELSGGTYLPVDFEPNESAFTELARHVRNKGSAERSAVRSVYFLGILAGVNYRDLRHLQRPDATSLVETELGADPTLAVLAEQGGEAASAGDESTALLDEVLGASEEPTGVDAMLGVLARQERDGAMQIGEECLEATAILDRVRDAVTSASEEAREMQRDVDALSAPSQRLAKAKFQLSKAIDALPRARAVPGWEEARFVAALEEVQEQVERLVGECD